MPRPKRGTKPSGFLTPLGAGVWDGFSPLPCRGTSTASCSSPCPIASSSTTSSSSSALALIDVHPRPDSFVQPTSKAAARRDAPVLAYSRRADPYRAIAALNAPGGREDMLCKLQADFSAASGSGNRASLLSTWMSFHSEWFGPLVPAVPVTTDSLLAVSSLFKKAGYRSFPNYLSAIKAEHVLRGHDWTQILDLMGRWSTRSVLRGIGPARQSQAIDLLRVYAIPVELDPVFPGGPVSPRRLFILGSQFILRELEIAVAVVSHWTFDHTLSTITWNLPTSKTDVMAVGIPRTWGCICSDHYAFPCPFHIAVEHIEDLRNTFGDVGPYFPLFPDTSGHQMKKLKVVEAFEALATTLSLPLITNGVRNFGGHSTRVSGSQFWAGLGIETAKIAIFARWAGPTIFRYVADAPLKVITADVRRLLLKACSTSSTSSQADDTFSDRLKTLERSLASLVDQAAASDVATLPALRDTAPSATQAICDLPVSPEYVSNDASLKVHEVWFRDDDPSVARARCGWKYRTSAHTFSRNIAMVAWFNMCDRCLRSERAAAKVRQNGDASDGQSSD